MGDSKLLCVEQDQFSVVWLKQTPSLVLNSDGPPATLGRQTPRLSPGITATLNGIFTARASLSSLQWKADTRHRLSVILRNVHNKHVW